MMYQWAFNTEERGQETGVGLHHQMLPHPPRPRLELSEQMCDWSVDACNQQPSEMQLVCLNSYFSDSATQLIHRSKVSAKDTLSLGPGTRGWSPTFPSCIMSVPYFKFHINITVAWKEWIRFLISCLWELDFVILFYRLLSTEESAWSTTPPGQSKQSNAANVSSHNQIFSDGK